MGVVYKAEDTKLKRIVALKLMPVNLALDEESKARFWQEARSAAQLDHPRVGTIHEINETEDGEMFIAMAYYAGETLQDKIDKGCLPIDESIDIARQIAHGLQEAHAHGVVHRDVKPANIMLTEKGFVKVVDFGLAKLGGLTRITQPGTSMGTPGYMSPEQVKGNEVDHRCDVWAVSVILYEMLTGSLPFKGDDKMSMLYNIVNESPTPVVEYNQDLPEELQAIFAKAFHKDIEQRHASTQDLLTDIDAIPILQPVNTDAINTVIMPPAKQTLRQQTATPKKRAGNAKIAFALVAVAVSAFAAINYFGKEPREPTRPAFTQIDSTAQEASNFVKSDSNKISTQSFSRATDETGTQAKPGIIAVSSQQKTGDAAPENENVTNEPEASLAAGIEKKKTFKAELDSDNSNRKAPTKRPLANSKTSEKQPLVELQKFGQLIVTSEPPGANIDLNDSLTSRKTPFSFTKINPGNYKIRLALAGYFPDSANVKLTENGKQSVNRKLVEESPATLSVSAVIQTGDTESMAFAEIFVDGRRSGQTPKSLPLERGEYTIEAKLFGYNAKDSKKTIVLESGGNQTLKFVFTKK